MPAPRNNKSGRNDKAPKTRRARVGEEPPFRKPGARGKAAFGDREERGNDEKSRFGDKPYAKKEFGDKPSFGDKPFRKKEFGDKPAFGDKPFRKKEWGDKSESGDKPFRKKEFGDKPSFGDKPFRKKESGGNPSFGDKPFRKKEWGDKAASGDRPFKKKEFGDKPSFGDKPFRKKESGDNPSFGDKPFRKKEWGDKAASSDRPFKKKEFGDKPLDRKDSSDKPFRKKYPDKDGDSAKSGEFKSARPYSATRRPEKTDDRKEYKGERKPFEKRSSDRPERKSFDRADSGERRSEGKAPAPKPFRAKKSFATPSDAAEEGLIRLNKYISNAGVCSRREADKLIETGVISVNGKIVTELGFKVSSTDEINFGGEKLRKEKAVYILLNKPKDYITTLDDPEGRKTVLELIKNATRERVYPVGRLDRNTTGLLLLTNDGDLTKKLTHPRYGVKKIYQVTLDKALTKGDMQKIAEGVELEDGSVKADEISYVGEGKDKNEVGIQLHSGRNRIVRRVFEHLGYDVVKLDRVYFAGLTKKDLPRGRWRMLTALEISMLKMVPSGD
jgi:23S rRNA pseudouridine2605 synthase